MVDAQSARERGDMRIEDTPVERWSRKSGKRDFKAFVRALRDMEVGQSMLWIPASNDRMAISIVAELLGRRYATRKEGETGAFRVGRLE